MSNLLVDIINVEIRNMVRQVLPLILQLFFKQAGTLSSIENDWILVSILIQIFRSCCIAS